MGMYTEFHLNIRLKHDTPQGIFDTLDMMLSLGDDRIPDDDHKLFECDRWWVMLRCTSVYFPQITASSREGHCLSIRCDFKNYDGEIRLFLNWLRPHIDALPGDFLGFYRYEEDQKPTFIFYREM